MKAGRLRHVLVLQEKVVVKGTYGGEEITWNTIDTVRGSIEYLSGKEGFTGDAFWGKNIVRFKIRYINVSVLNRVVYDGRNFDIIPPIRVSNDIKKEMLLTAEEEAE